jgi:hypothetical protein
MNSLFPSRIHMVTQVRCAAGAGNARAVPTLVPTPDLATADNGQRARVGAPSARARRRDRFPRDGDRGGGRIARKDPRRHQRVASRWLLRLLEEDPRTAAANLLIAIRR